MPRNGVARLAVLFGLMALPAWTMVACGSSPTTLEPATSKLDPGLTDVATATPVNTPSVAPTLIPDTPTSVPTSPATAAPAPTASTENASTATPATDTPGVEVKFVIAKKDAEGKISVLEDDNELVSCTDADAADPEVGCDDVYGLYFEPAQESYIYALQQDETGNIDVLFPNKEFSEKSNPVAAGTKLWVPNNFKEWFYLGQNSGPDPIEETIFVAASAERIDVVESYMACVIETCSDSDPAQEAQRQFVRDRLGLGGSTSGRDPISDPEGNMTDLKSLILDSAGEDELVYQLTFKNLPAN